VVRWRGVGVRHIAVAAAAAFTFALGMSACGDAEDPAAGAGTVTSAPRAQVDEIVLKRLRTAGVKNPDDVIAAAAQPDTPAARRARRSGASDDALRAPSLNVKQRFEQQLAKIEAAQSRASAAQREVRRMTRARKHLTCITAANADPAAVAACERKADR
jgi:uncharacterized membrane protein